MTKNLWVVPTTEALRYAQGDTDAVLLSQSPKSQGKKGSFAYNDGEALLNNLKGLVLGTAS